MKKFLALIALVIFALLILALNGVLAYGIIWELFISTKEPNWFPMIMSILTTGFLDVVIVIFALDK